MLVMQLRLNFISKILLIGLLCLLASFCLPVWDVTDLVAILTAATFLFSVLYGFEISIVINNFAQLKTQLAIENAGLLTIYHLGDIIGGDAFKKISERLESYLLKSIDVPLENHLLGTNKEFFAIWEPVKELNDVDGAQRGQALQYLNEAIYYVPQARNQVADVAPRFVDSSVWLMLVFLSMILIGALFVGRGADVFSQVTAAIFSTTVIGALLLLDEVDSNRIREAYVEYEMFNDTLEQVGKTRYYPEFALKKGIITLPKGEYRIGRFTEYPSLDERQVEVVNAK
jgi:hypothetical protein